MSNLLTDISDGIGTLTLNAPEARNTMTMPMVEEICAAMDAFEADEGCSSVIVTGAGSAFCAGADLGNLQTATAESLGTIYEGFLRIARSTLPTIAAVNGAAVGAGMNLGADLGHQTRFARQLGHHPSLRNRARQRLLAVHVFAKFNG